MNRNRHRAGDEAIRHAMKRTTRTQRVVADLTAMVLVGTQLVLPPNAEASHLGSSTASAGSAPPPAASAIQSFQPDLFTGRATLAIPIALPPGRKGVQPSLALTYSSSGRNGWVGDSWMVDVSYLERSTKNGVPTYDASDTFTFVSQNTSVDLVQIPDGTYRAKDEGAFLRFESKGVSGWEVRDKSGMRYFFGQTAVSQIESAGKVFRWALEKVIDPSGNTILYTYAKDQNQLYLSRIDYTGHEPTSAAPTNQILFTLEDRPDKDTSLRSGFPVTTAKRLKTIEAKATVDTVVSLARRYDLTYATSTRTGRSLLTSVTQVGSDGTTTLPPSTFTYQQSANTSSLTTPGQSLKQLLVGDVEGNGSAELINYDATSATWTVACATASCPGLSTGTWMTGFGTATDIPLVGDWNGDGRTDVGLYNASNGHQWQFATSGGGSFVIQAAWGLVFGSGTPLSGDFNGDGKTDVGTYDKGTWSIALGTGSGFTTPALFNLSWGAAIYDPLIGDFNGDGLTDIALVENATGNISVRLSTGAGWTEATTWLTGFGPNQEHTSADFTEDGLSDVVYYDHATGRVMVAPSTGSAFGAAVSLPVTFTQTSTNDVLQMGDFNGDGLLDPAVFNSATGSAQLSFSQGSPADLLLSVANGLGGATSLTYQPSSILGHTTLPFITSVVQTITTSDGLGNTYATTYNYDGGLYDAPTKEFRGFAKTQVLDAEHQVALTQFHQDEHRKGHVVHSEFRDTFGNLWTQTDQTWVCTDLFPNVHFTHLDQTDAVTYDGDATSKQTRARFTYDAYGNLTRTDEDGEVTLTGDERSTMTAFLYNPTDWILNTPSLVQTLDATSTVVAQRRFFYDGAASHTTAPTVGNLTKEEEWLNLPTEQWLATSLTYDAYGNVTTVTDALSRTTTNTYDPTGTYLIQIQNTLGHTRQLIYDPRFGSVTSSTDQNTQTTTTQYDPLGRVLKVIGPTDTATLPTISYAYDLSTLPNKTTVSTRVQSGSPNVLTVYAFSDGLGRTIQTRSPAEDPAKQVVTGTVQFNSRGLVTKQWVAYLDTFSTSYRPLSLVTDHSSLATVSYTYDPLGRTLTLTDPDGSVTSTTYHDWDVTVTDALGHQTTRTSDAYGRLSKVEEFNGAAVYTTTYQYDPRNNLTKV
ncbi:MAG: VCBS repeat-containing protein, partial [Candidatus Omnitrophica bacterium]|nr:VCBS repeat-containing protein [Candidatus Omnitrophota bacterium]